jgi:hypothetical protein
MLKSLLAAALGLSAASAAAQTQLPAELNPVIQDVPGRWIWRLRPDSVLRVRVPGIGESALEFWIAGENRGTTGARYANARIGLDCASGRFVRERLVSFDAARNQTSESTIGDHPRNWAPIVAGTSIDGARRLLCPAA